MKYEIKSLFTKFALSFFVVFFGYNEQRAWSAPCCARSAAAPFLILTDDEAQIGLGVSAVDAVANVFEKAAFRPSGRTDFTNQYRVDGALLLSDRLQMGLSAAMVGRFVGSTGNPENNLGFGDTRLSLGYEYLPAWNYSAWKPQGFLFSVVTLPTGRSKFELGSGDSKATVTGLGFYSVALGSIFLKRWNVIDGFIIVEAHYSLPRTFATAYDPQVVVPGLGGSAGFGLGWSPGGGNWRVGLRVQPRVDQVPTNNGIPEYLALPRVISSCDTGFDLSYMLGNSQTIMMSYTDQTLLGYAANTNLNRVLALNFQHRWER